MKKSIFYPAILILTIANPAFSETKQEIREATIQSEIRLAKKSPYLHYWFNKPSVMAKYLLMNRQFCYFPQSDDTMPENPSFHTKSAWSSSYQVKEACQYAAYRVFQIATKAINPSDHLQFTYSDMVNFNINSKREIGLYSIIDR